VRKVFRGMASDTSAISIPVVSPRDFAQMEWPWYAAAQVITVYDEETSEADLQTALTAAAARANNAGLAGTDADGVPLLRSAFQFWDMRFTGDVAVTRQQNSTLIGRANMSSLPDLALHKWQLPRCVSAEQR
jgi:hypothetical protein